MPEKRATLLVELLTEELPPKSLRALSEVFMDRLCNGLERYQLISRDPRDRRIYATPRRLAASIPGVAAAGVDRENEVSGPSANAPAPAIAGFARKQGVEVSALERRDTPKGQIVVARVRIKGAALDRILAPLVEEALKAMPIAKVMRWGSGEAQFVRPVHGLVMLHGKHVVPGRVLGLESTHRTRGHRFMGKSEIALADADEYESKLREAGMVIADFAARRAEIERQLQAEAARVQAGLGKH